MQNMRMVCGAEPPMRLSVAALAVLATVSLAGCSDSNFSLNTDDAVGTWRAGSDLPTQLELAADGTFKATSWPLDVSCNATSPLTVEAVRESETRDLSGTWEEGEGGAQNELKLFPEGDVCRTGRITAEFRDEGGVRYSCINLGVLNEESEAGNYFILYLGEPKRTPAPDACFSYN